MNKNMNIIFRTDGNREIGMGHIVRCLSLADELKDNEDGSKILFITKYGEGRRAIEGRDYGVILTEDNEVSQIGNLADRETLLITDFLDTDNSYICKIKKFKNLKLIAIDNNTKLKEIKADMVINANVFNEGETKVIGFTKYYLGLKYMILRRKFEIAHRAKKQIKDKVGTILVMSGGADSLEGQLILNSIKALEKIKEEVCIHLIIGPAFPYISELDELLAKATRRFDISFNPSNLVEIMEGADMAITAAGITLCELATLGIPLIVIPQVTPLTSHQEYIASAFERHGACLNLGRLPDNELIYGKSTMLMQDKSLRERLSENAKALVDGKGLERVLRLIYEVCGVRAQ